MFENGAVSTNSRSLLQSATLITFSILDVPPWFRKFDHHKLHFGTTLIHFTRVDSL